MSHQKKTTPPWRPKGSSAFPLPPIPELPDLHQDLTRGEGFVDTDDLSENEDAKCITPPTANPTDGSRPIPIAAAKMPPRRDDEQQEGTSEAEEDDGNAAYRRQQRELTLARIRRMEEDRERRQRQQVAPQVSCQQGDVDLSREPSVHSSFVKDMVSHTSLVLKPSPKRSDEDEDPCESFASSFTSLMESSVGSSGTG